MQEYTETWVRAERRRWNQSCWILSKKKSLWYIYCSRISRKLNFLKDAENVRKPKGEWSLGEQCSQGFTKTQTSRFKVWKKILCREQFKFTRDSTFFHRKEKEGWIRAKYIEKQFLKDENVCEILKQQYEDPLWKFHWILLCRDLKVTLQTAVGRECFKQYLESEFSHENLEFYEMCETLKTTPFVSILTFKNFSHHKFFTPHIFSHQNFFNPNNS